MTGVNHPKPEARCHPRMRVLTAVLVSVVATACTGIREQADPRATLELTRPVTIPAGRAHTIFQAGRQVSAANNLDPYCELEIKTVSEQTQIAEPGLYGIRGVRVALLRDPVTRVPALIAGWSCADPVFRESLWLLRPMEAGNLHSLRCIRPLYHCRMAPPLQLADAERLSGGAVRVVSQRAPVHSP